MSATQKYLLWTAGSILVGVLFKLAEERPRTGDAWVEVAFDCLAIVATGISAAFGMSRVPRRGSEDLAREVDHYRVTEGRKPDELTVIPRDEYARLVARAPAGGARGEV